MNETFDDLYEIDPATSILRQKRLLVLKGYDAEYIRTRYDRYPLLRKMNHDRADLLLSEWRRTFTIPLSAVLDFGCGNGSFLEDLEVPEKWGHDICQYPTHVPMTDDRFKQVDAVTFFDSLEHVKEAPEVIGKLNCRLVMISLPWCHYSSLGSDWFMAWKHRRYGEHLWHFDAVTLTVLMASHGFRLSFIGNPEDQIRTPDTIYPNILTATFVRK